MNRYLKDPTLQLTQVILRVLRWLLLGFSGALAFVAMASLAVDFFAEPEFFNGLSPRSVSMSREQSIFAIIGMLVAAVMLFQGSLIIKNIRWIVQTVEHENPLTSANSKRLRSIAWLILSLEVVGLIASYFTAIGFNKLDPLHAAALDTDDVVSLITALLTAALVFILARVFETGARMQDDLEGTV